MDLEYPSSNLTAFLALMDLKGDVLSGLMVCLGGDEILLGGDCCLYAGAAKILVGYSSAS